MSNGTELSNRVFKALKDVLPREWSLSLRDRPPNSGIDAWVEIRAPSGLINRFAIQAKNEIRPRDIGHVDQQLPRPLDAEPLIIVPRLTKRSRELLRQFNISYADAEGNFRLSTDKIFVEHERDGDRRLRASDYALSRSSLRGRVTGKVIRFLTDAMPPYGVRYIAGETATHPGNVSRLLGLLQHEHLIERDDEGTVNVVHWDALIKSWADALQRDRVIDTFLDPRGVEHFTKELHGNKISRYVLTGSYAASQIVPVALPTSVDIYVEDARLFIDRLNLRPVAPGVGNIRLIEPFDAVVFERSLNRNGFSLANPSQIATDLLTLPRRSKEELNALITWMEENERDWRVA